MQTIPSISTKSGGLSIAQLAARAGALKRQRGLDVLVIDYLQLLGGSKTRSDSRVQEVTEITTGLKALAKDLKVPVIALSQLSRQVENRDDKRPQLSDLRESGSIEQDAMSSSSSFAKEYYLNKQTAPRGNRRVHQVAGRHGKGAWQSRNYHRQAAARPHRPPSKLAFEAEMTRFSNLAREDSLPEHF